MMMIYMIYQVLGVYLSFVYVNVIAIYVYLFGCIYMCVLVGLLLGVIVYC